MTISISWQHEAAQAPAFASLLPKAIEATDRWITVPGKLQEDEFGVYYWMQIRDEPQLKSPLHSKFWVLRPSTLRLGAMKAIQDAPDHWMGYSTSLMQIFENLALGCAPHRPTHWDEPTLDFMVQLAWFREVMFA